MSVRPFAGLVGLLVAVQNVKLAGMQTEGVTNNLLLSAETLQMKGSQTKQSAQSTDDRDMCRINDCSGMAKTVLSLVLFILLLASLSSSTWCQEQEDTDEEFERARGLFEVGDLLQAAALFEDVVISQPDHKEARALLITCYRFLGIEYYGQSRYDDAIDSWRKALKIDPQNKELQSYITRSVSEMKATAHITGDTSLAVDSLRSPQMSPLVYVDSDSVLQSTAGVSAAIPGDEFANTTSHHAINFGLSSGIAVGTGSSHGLKRGTAFVGYLSYLSDEHRLGTRLDGIYTRFYRNFSGATLAPRHLVISGLNMSAIISARVSHSALVDCSVGLGIYEIILTEPNDDQYSSTTRKSSAVGASFGVGSRKKMGTIAVTVDAKYTHYYSSLSPNVLQISVGITSK